MLQRIRHIRFHMCRFPYRLLQQCMSDVINNITDHRAAKADISRQIFKCVLEFQHLINKSCFFLQFHLIFSINCIHVSIHHLR
ncbi:hypothetical protein MJG53_011714 [Ovis ammon polii x Ovis aries]|uniref:Uncharacterized protein n=1 Tax=Ovis ammon polii x Ovis aries TaxID=2918886 RepID=A0ACB9UPF6_9CETA|nr:hypothetical protein MJT46_011344 [Ovis ammon polii x Ovis aries]KAI4575511.1 hypothetical protein MJG53_011714 [Ovis ammon polii x Ovis aries]